jgi:hypothetical protein
MDKAQVRAGGGEDRRAMNASREYLRSGGEGVPFKQVAADCGFIMEQIRNYKRE